MTCCGSDQATAVATLHDGQVQVVRCQSCYLDYISLFVQSGIEEISSNTDPSYASVMKTQYLELLPLINCRAGSIVGRLWGNPSVSGCEDRSYGA